MGEWPFDASRGVKSKKLNKTLASRSGLLAAGSALALLSHGASAQNNPAPDGMVALAEIEGVASVETLSNGDVRVVFENGREMIVPANQVMQAANGIFITADMAADMVSLASAGASDGALLPAIGLAGLGGALATAFSGGRSDGSSPTPESTPINNAPVFTSANASQAAENQTATGLTVSASDADGDTVVYSISGGADASLFEIDASTGILSFVNAPDFEMPTDAGGDNVYNLQVTANDRNGGAVAQDIAVTVTDVAENVAPQITSVAQATVDENTVAVATVTASDADGDAVTFAISGGADAALFAIDAATGELTFAAAPDFETPDDADSDNVFEITVTANDGNGGINAQNLTITVADIDENSAPEITSNAQFQINENDVDIGSVTANDADGDTLSFALEDSGDAALFAIDAVTGALSFRAAPDFENPADSDADNAYQTTVTVSDGRGGAASQSITVTIADVDEMVAVNNPPQIISADAVRVSENSVETGLIVNASDADGDTVTYAISGGADADLFAIGPATGALSFIAAPDFEVPTDADGNNVYDVTVSADDGNGATVAQQVAVTVTDIDESISGGNLIGPSAVEQLLVELINRARANPGEELGLLVPQLDPNNAVHPNIEAGLEFFQTNLALIQQQLEGRAGLAPLAWSDELGASATRHSELMVLNDEQVHDFPGEPGLLGRIAEQGYAASRAIENIFAYGQTAEHAHASFFIDYGPGPDGIQNPADHREAVLDANVFEVGVGIVTQGTDNTFAGPLVTTQHFASRVDYTPQVVGVIFRDFDENDFYGIGEGVGAINVVATGAAGTFATQSWASGGYQIALPDGDYTMTFSGDALGGTIVRQVTVSGANIKVDLDLPGAPDLISTALELDSGAAGDGITNDGSIGIAALAGVTLSSLMVSLDGGAPVNVLASLGAGDALVIGPETFGLSNYSGGAHTVTIEALDENGLVETETLNFTFDAEAPDLTNVRLAPSSDTGARGDSITSQSAVALIGQAEAGSVVSFAGQSVIVPVSGQFQLAEVDLSSGNNSLQVEARDAAGNLTTQTVNVTVDGGADGGSPVLAWIEVTLQAIKLSAAPDTEATRVLAMESVAVLDAIAAIDGTPGYLTPISGAQSGSVDAAIATAAYTVLLDAFPDQRAMLDAALIQALAGLPRDAAFDTGVSAGLAAAQGTIEAREFDGTDNYENFVGGNDAGQWRPTGPMFEPGQTPQYGDAQTWVITTPDQFQPDGPPALDSDEYAASLASVRAIGDANSAIRTEDQTDAVIFWTAGGGTFTTPGHWNDIALTFTQAEGGTSIAEHALIFATLNVALADTAIAAWDTKYDEAFWRPSTAINNADQDGNPGTIADPNWRPFLIDPNHPDYVSGHASISGAAATVLANFFGDENAIAVRSEDMPGTIRNYTSFSEIAQEQSDAREWAGVHFNFSNEDGLDLGEDVAQFVLGSFTRDNDSAAPIITLDGGRVRVSDGDITLTGRVSDFASGVSALIVSINGAAPVDLVISADGRFSLPIADDGELQKTIAFVATDGAGNVTDPVNVDLTIDSEAPVITLDSFASGDVISGDTFLSGFADPSGTDLISLRYSFDGGVARPVNFDRKDGSFSEALQLGDLAPGAHTLTLTARDGAGNVTTQDFDVFMDDRIVFELSSVEPQNDLSNVGVTKRPQITFNRPVDPDTVNEDSFYASDPSGEKLDAKIVVSSDGMRAFLFLDEAMPGNARITLTVDGDVIKAASDGGSLDGNGDGIAGGVFELDFKTVGTSDLAGTSIEGRVFGPGADLTPMTRDDFRAGNDRTPFTDDDVFLNPIAGAKVFILGREDITVITDENGYFKLEGIPSGNVKLAVDGRTATNAPDGFFFPEMVMDLDIEAGRANTVMEAMGVQEQRAGNIGRDELYLPQLPETMLRDVAMGSQTTVGLAAAGVSEELSPEEIASVSLVVDGSSLIGEDGLRMDGGQVGIATVPPELVRDMLPDGLLQHTFDITIQAPGVAAFDVPAELTVPNVFDAAPGTQLNFLSFDHTTGRLIIEGTATVSEDGKTVTTDPGTGITKPGWHGVTPPGSETTHDGKDPCDDADTGGSGADTLLARADQQLTDTLAKLNALRKSLDDFRTGLIEIKTTATGVVKLGTTLNELATKGIERGDTADTVRAFTKSAKDLLSAVDEAGGGLSIGINGDVLRKANKDLIDARSQIESLKSLLAGAETGVGVFADPCLSDAEIMRLQNRLDAAIAVEGQLSAMVSLAADADSVDKLVSFITGNNLVVDIIKEQVNAGLLTLEVGTELVDRRGDQVNFLRLALEAEQRGDTATADRLYEAAYARSDAENGVPAFAAANEQTALQFVLIEDLLTPEEQDEFFDAAQVALGGLMQIIEEAIGDDGGVEVIGIIDGLLFGLEQLDGIEELFTPLLASTFGYPADAPFRITGEAVDLRGTTDGNGALTVFLPAETELLLEIYDAKNNLIARSEFTTNRSGQPTDIPDPQLSVVSLLQDTDGDLLVDDAETIVGTSITRSDTDGDGISDYQELLAGTNPVGIFGPVTGPVASLDVGSEIFDIEVVRFETGAITRVGLLATAAGVSIVNLTGAQPELISSIALDTRANDIAVDTVLGVMVVSTQAGIKVYDISVPADPVQIDEFSDATALLEIVDGQLVYVVDDNDLIVRDLTSGEVTSQLSLDSSILELARDGSRFYVGQSDDLLTIVDINNSMLTERGSVASGTSNDLTDLIVGEGDAFGIVTGLGGGLLSFDVSDPDNPVLIERVINGGYPSDALAVGGTGLALIAGFNGNENSVELYDLSDPANLTQLVTRFPFDARPTAAEIAGGTGYVGDANGLLTIINYVSPDVGEVAPTIALEVDAIDRDPTVDGVQALEGDGFTVLARADDDVEISRVELLIDGVPSGSDLTFPYALDGKLPFLTQDDNGDGLVQIQLRAIDTGGNVGLSNVVEIAIRPDTFAPQILSTSPSDDSAIRSDKAAFVVRFDEDIDPLTIDIGQVSITSASNPGTTFEAISATLSPTGAAIIYRFEELEQGDLLLTFDPAGIADLLGNASIADAITLGVTSAAISQTYIGGPDGSWFDAANWSAGRIPNENDVVLIDSGVTVIIADGQAQSAQIFINSGTLLLQSGSLDAGQIDAPNAGFEMTGGTLSNTTVDSGDQVKLNGTLDNVTLESAASVTNGGTLTIVNGLTINSELEISGTAAFTSVVAGSGQTISGSGTLAFLDEDNGFALNRFIVGEADGERGILTFGPDLTIEGREGQFVNVSGANDAISLLGTIKTNGALKFEVDVENDGAAVTLDTGDGRISFDKNLDNVQLVGVGTPVSLTIANGANIVSDVDLALFGTANLDNLTLNSDAILTNGSTLNVADGLTINGTLELAGIAAFTQLVVGSGETIGGNGTLKFLAEENGFRLNRVVIGEADGERGSVTFGPDLTIESEEGQIVRPFGADDTIKILGTVKTTNATDFIEFQVDVDNNDAALTIDNGDGRVVFQQGLANVVLEGAGAVATLSGADGSNIIADLDVTVIGNASLADSVVNAIVTVTNGATLNVTDGLTVNGTVEVAGTSAFTQINATSGQTIAGTGTIKFLGEESSSQLNRLIVGENDGERGTLVFGSDLTIESIEGQFRTASGANDAVSLLGTIKTANIGDFIDFEVDVDNGGAAVTIDNGDGVISFESGFDNTLLIGPGATASFSGASGSNVISEIDMVLVNTTLTDLFATNDITVGANTTLSGAHINSDVTIVSGGGLTVEDGLELNGSLTLAGVNAFTVLNIGSGQEITGNGSIHFNGENNSAALNQLVIGENDGVTGNVAFGDGITLSGEEGLIVRAGGASDTISIDGTLASIEGDVLTIDVDVANSGNAINFDSAGGAIVFDRTLSDAVLNGTADSSVILRTLTMTDVVTNIDVLLRGDNSVTGTQLNGATTVENGSILRVTDDLQINGVLTLDGSGAFTQMLLASGTEVTGNGIIRFAKEQSSFTLNQIVIGEAAGADGRVTLGPDLNVIAGEGLFTNASGADDVLTILSNVATEDADSALRFDVEIDNQGQAFELDNQAGRVIFDTTLTDVVIEGTDGSFAEFRSLTASELVVLNLQSFLTGASTYDNSRFDGETSLTNGSQTTVTSGLVLNGELSLDGTSAFTRLTLTSDQTISGNADIHFSSENSSFRLNEMLVGEDDGATGLVIFGQGIRLVAGEGSINNVTGADDEIRIDGEVIVEDGGVLTINVTQQPPVTGDAGGGPSLISALGKGFGEFAFWDDQPYGGGVFQVFQFELAEYLHYMLPEITRFETATIKTGQVSYDRVAAELVEMDDNVIIHEELRVDTIPNTGGEIDNTGIWQSDDFESGLVTRIHTIGDAAAQEQIMGLVSEWANEGAPSESSHSSPAVSSKSKSLEIDDLSEEFTSVGAGFESSFDQATHVMAELEQHSALV